MNADSMRLRDEAQRLLRLAATLEDHLDQPIRRTNELIGKRQWLGKQAERTRDELRQTQNRLKGIAEQLRQEAGARMREAQRLDPTIASPYGGSPYRAY